MPERPNILVIMSDEHDRAVAGCYGDKAVHTPHLDGLAERGVTFDAAYTTSPLCVPGRLSFTACQYISRCGGWNNSCWLPSDEYPSIARALNAAGYESILGGKMHFDATRHYGFRDLYPTNQNRMFKTGTGRPRQPDDPSIAVKGWQGRSADFHTGEDSSVLKLDREVTRQCSKFLAERKKDDPPFFLLAGYLAPHFPLIVPERLHKKYIDRVPMPHIPDGFLDTLPTNYKQIRQGFGVVETEPEKVKLGRELYWAFAEWFDEEVGKLLGALESSAVARNTIVVYTSDHGENKGDHGMWWKNCMYEHAAGVPLIVSWPERWAGGQRRSGACSFMDLVQGLADWGGAQPHESWDGDSLTPYMDDANYAWKDFALSEYYGHNTCSGFTMVRSGRWKYVYHNRINETYGPERQLFDMAEDPGEFHNLAADPAHAARIAELHARMIKELGEDPDAINRRWLADTEKGYGRQKPAGARTANE